MPMERLEIQKSALADMFIPAVSEFEEVIFAKEVFEELEANGIDLNRSRYNEVRKYCPWTIAHQAYKADDTTELIRYFLIAYMIHWDELADQVKWSLTNSRISKETLTEVFETAWKQALPTIKARYGVALNKAGQGKTYAIDFLNRIQKEEADGIIVEVNVKSQNSPMYRLITYNRDCNPPVRRHLMFRKKDRATNIYKIGVEGARITTSWWNEPRFESIAQAEEFAKSAKNLRSKQKVHLFKFVISDKPFDNGVKDLSDCELVMTDLGPAYISHKSDFFESLATPNGQRLAEANYNYAQEVEKMRELDNGTRGFNAKATSDDKLLFKYNITRSHDFKRARAILTAELYARKMIKYIMAEDNIPWGTDHLWAEHLRYCVAKLSSMQSLQDGVDSLVPGLASGSLINYSRYPADLLLPVLIFAILIKNDKLSAILRAELIRHGVKESDMKRYLIEFSNDTQSKQKMFELIRELSAVPTAKKLFESFNGALNESLLEDIEKHDELNDKLWKNNKLKDEVKEKILAIVDEFVEGLSEDDVVIEPKDVVLIGSNCSYNYTKDSDLDIHIVADAQDILTTKLYSAYRSLFNKKFDIDFYGIPVEIYVDTENTPTVSNGIYSVMNDSWIKEPVKEDIPDIDMDAFNKEFKVWEDEYNKLVAETGEPLKESLLNEDLSDAKAIIADQIRGEWEAIRNYEKAVDDLTAIGDNFDDIIKLLTDISDEEEVHVGELQRAQAILDDNVLDNIDEGEDEAEEKLAEVQSPVDEALNEKVSNEKLDKINKFIEDVYQLRKDSLAKDGEYSIGNLIFKELRNRGYLDNLKELKNQIVGRELSLEALEEPEILQDEQELDEAVGLSNKELTDYKIKLQQIAHIQPIVQVNGRFDFYNVRESDAEAIVAMLRRADFVDYVQKSAGKFDFNHVKFNGKIDRYYNIFGQIKN